MAEIFTKVQEIVADKLGVDIEQVTPEASFAEDLGADSLDIVELVMALEDEFSIDIPEDKAEKIVTVEDAVNYIKSTLSEQMDTPNKGKTAAKPVKNEVLKKI